MNTSIMQKKGSQKSFGMETVCVNVKKSVSKKKTKGKFLGVHLIINIMNRQ